MNKYLLITTLLILCCYAYTESVNKHEFADYLYQSKLYEMAIPEYYRAMYNGSTADSIRSLTSIARCYANTLHIIESVNTYKKISDYDPTNWEASYSRALLLNQIHNFYESNTTINEVISKYAGAKQDSLRLVKAVNYINLGRYMESYDVLSEITTPDIKQRATRIKAVLDSNLPLKTKKNMHAVLLQAIIPGSGYLYCGMPQTALATFVVNSLLGFAVYDNFHKGNTGSGLVFSITAGGFYLGSIFGGLQAVSKYNNRLLENLSLQIYP